MSNKKKEYISPTYKHSLKFPYSSPKYEKRFYLPLSEFRYNNSKDGRNHPNYVFGYIPVGTEEMKKDMFYSIGITTDPPTKGPNAKKYKYKKLSKKVDPNPKPKYINKPDYICINSVHKNNTKCYGKVLNGWKFAEEDKKVADDIIDKHLLILERENSSKSKKHSQQCNKRKNNKRKSRKK